MKGNSGSLMSLLAVVILMCLSGCATQSIRQMEERSKAAGSWGFVSEIDEPSSRGLLKRISPEECDVRSRICLSPDGKYIVYSGTQGRVSEGTRLTDRAVHLWRIPCSGGSPVKITSGGTVDCEYPSYTGDGKFIVYASGGTLWKIQENGAGGRTRIPGSGIGEDFAPNVAPDGRIAFCSIQNALVNEQLYPKPFIWICDPNGGNLTQLREGLFPMWSPDSRSLVFVYDGDVWSVGSDGTELTQLCNTPEIYEGIPSFSPDGRHIVYISNEGKDGKPLPNDFNIWQMNRDGSEKTQITELRSWDSWPAYARDGIYFLSARAAANTSARRQRIWKLETKAAEESSRTTQ